MKCLGKLYLLHLRLGQHRHSITRRRSAMYKSKGKLHPHQRKILGRNTKCRRTSVCIGRWFIAQVRLANDVIYLAQKLDKLLNKLMPVDCSHKHRVTSAIRQSDTCMWLPTADVYKLWREGTSRTNTLLWLQGKGTSYQLNILLLIRSLL